MFKEYIQQFEEAWRQGVTIDPDEYPDKSEQGLEGPFSFGDWVLYYDAKEGKYYDSRTDMYVTSDEMQELQNADQELMNKHGRESPYIPTDGTSTSSTH